MGMQEIDKDGKKGPIKEYDSEKMLQALADPKVKEVRVFRLEKGMIIQAKGAFYEIVSLNSKGAKATLHLSKVLKTKKKSKKERRSKT